MMIIHFGRLNKSTKYLNRMRNKESPNRWKHMAYSCGKSLVYIASGVE